MAGQCSVKGLRRRAWLAGVLSVWACAEAVDPVPDASSDARPSPAIEVGGAGDDGTGFVDWRDGTAEPGILMGPQGGQHVWIRVRGQGLHPKKLRLSVEMRDAETDEVVKPGELAWDNLTLEPEAGDPSWSRMTGQAKTAYVKEPCKIMGRRLLVLVEASDLYGVKASDSAFITPGWAGWCSPP